MTAKFSRLDLTTDLDARLETQLASMQALLEALGPIDRREVRHVILRGQMAQRHPSPRRRADALAYALRFHAHIVRKLSEAAD